MNILNNSIQTIATKRAPWKIKVEKLLENFIVVGTMSSITIYSLFFDDVRVLGTTVDYDYIFYVITCICLVMFAVEIVLASISKEVYFLTFFFWLDVVSTLSMIPDIGLIWDLMTGGGGGGSKASNAT